LYSHKHFYDKYFCFVNCLSHEVFMYLMTNFFEVIVATAYSIFDRTVLIYM